MILPLLEIEEAIFAITHHRTFEEEEMHANLINVLPLGTAVPRTTYRHLHDTLLRRDVADVCFYYPELTSIFSGLKGETEYTILPLGSGHMDDHVSQPLHLSFEEFVVSLNDKNPDLKVSVLQK